MRCRSAVSSAVSSAAKSETSVGSSYAAAGAGAPALISPVSGSMRRLSVTFMPSVVSSLTRWCFLLQPLQHQSRCHQRQLVVADTALHLMPAMQLLQLQRQL